MTRIYSLAVVFGNFQYVATFGFTSGYSNSVCILWALNLWLYLLVVCRVTQTQWAVLFYILFFFWLGYGSPSYLLIGNCGHFIEFASPLSLSPLPLTHNLILLSKTLHTSPSTKAWLCGWTVSCIVQSLGRIVDVFGFISQVIGCVPWLLIALLLHGKFYAVHFIYIIWLKRVAYNHSVPILQMRKRLKQKAIPLPGGRVWTWSQVIQF